MPRNRPCQETPAERCVRGGSKSHDRSCPHSPVPGRCHLCASRGSHRPGRACAFACRVSHRETQWAACLVSFLIPNWILLANSPLTSGSRVKSGEIWLLTRAGTPTQSEHMFAFASSIELTLTYSRISGQALKCRLGDRANSLPVICRTMPSGYGHRTPDYGNVV